MQTVNGKDLVNGKIAADYLKLSSAELAYDRFSNKLGIPYYKIGRLGQEAGYCKDELASWKKKHKRKKKGSVTIVSEQKFITSEQKKEMREAFAVWRDLFCKERGWLGVERLVCLSIYNKPIRQVVRGRSQKLLSERTGMSVSSINRLLRVGSSGCGYAVAQLLDDEMGGGVDLWVVRAEMGPAGPAGVLKERRAAFKVWQKIDDESEVEVKQ